MVGRRPAADVVRGTWLNRPMDTSTTAPAEERTSGALTYVLVAAVLLVAAFFAFSSSAVPNDWYAVFKVVHVLFAVIWVGGGTMLTIFAILAERSNDPAEIAQVAKWAGRVGEKLFAPSGLIVFLAGIALMLNTNWGWGRFWVVAGLVGYASTFVTGLFVISPNAKKLEALIAEKGPTHPDSIAQIRRLMLIARFDIAVLLLVVADMVTKPFS
jgi:uncharacterized membrane protein